MICTNCSTPIKVNDTYYRAGKAGTVFHSKACCYEAYEGFYGKKEVEKTITKHTRLQ